MIDIDVTFLIDGDPGFQVDASVSFPEYPNVGDIIYISMLSLEIDNSYHMTTEEAQDALNDQEWIIKRKYFKVQWNDETNGIETVVELDAYRE